MDIPTAYKPGDLDPSGTWRFTGSAWIKAKQDNTLAWILMGGLVGFLLLAVLVVMAASSASIPPTGPTVLEVSSGSSAIYLQVDRSGVASWKEMAKTSGLTATEVKGAPAGGGISCSSPSKSTVVWNDGSLGSLTSASSFCRAAGW